MVSKEVDIRVYVEKKEVDKRVYVAKVLHAYKIPVEFILEVVSYSEDVEKFYLSASKFVKKDFSYRFPDELSSKAFDFSGLRSKDIDALPLPFTGDFPPLKQPLGKGYFLDYLKDNKVRVIDYTQATVCERMRMRKLDRPRLDAEIESLYADKKEPMIMQTFSIAKADKDALQALADKNERSLASLIRLILKKHLKDYAHLRR